MSVAAKKACEKLNPRKIGSEKISLIFDKRISKGVLGTLSSSIVASSIARGTSFLKNKLDQKIFSKEINIIDKPDILKIVDQGKMKIKDLIGPNLPPNPGPIPNLK